MMDIDVPDVSNKSALLFFLRKGEFDYIIFNKIMHPLPDDYTTFQFELGVRLPPKRIIFDLADSTIIEHAGLNAQGKRNRSHAYQLLKEEALELVLIIEDALGDTMENITSNQVPNFLSRTL
jgi:hypothetical protein